MGTSERPKNTARAEQNKSNALKIFGGAYGNFFSHMIFPKRLG